MPPPPLDDLNARIEGESQTLADLIAEYAGLALSSSLASTVTKTRQLLVLRLEHMRASGVVNSVQERLESGIQMLDRKIELLKNVQSGASKTSAVVKTKR